MTELTAKQTIWPSHSSTEESIQAALTHLPITDPNVLVGLLKTHQNTVIDILSKTLFTKEPPK